MDGSSVGAACDRLAALEMVARRPNQTLILVNRLGIMAGCCV
jgi:hypothetical protein